MVFNKYLEYMFYLYLVILTLIPSKFNYKSIPLNADILLLLLIIFYILVFVIRDIRRKNFIIKITACLSNRVSLFLIITFVVMIISVLYSTDYKLALNESIRFGTYIFIYYIIRFELNNLSVLRNIINLYFILTTLLVIIGLTQWFFQTGVEFQIINSQNIIRVKSTLENSNNYGAFLILIFNPLLILSFNEKLKIKKLLYIFITILVVINIVLTQSRNALIFLIISFALLIVVYNWKFIFGFILMAITSMLLPQIQSRIKQIGDISQNSSRIKLWKTAILMIKDHPYIGIGNGNYMVIYEKYELKNSSMSSYHPNTKFHPHNIFLKIQSELGIIGFLPFAGLLISAFISIRKYINNSNDYFFKIYFKGFLISYICFIFMNLIDNFFTAPKVVTLFWISISVCEALLNSVRKY